MIVEVDKIYTATIMVARVALRRSEAKLLPVNRVNDLVEIGLRGLRRVVWDFDRIYGYRLAGYIGRLVSRLGVHAAGEKKAERKYQ
jgi:DNA-directed RNA polymerase specialized sigma subunit